MCIRDRRLAVHRTARGRPTRPDDRALLRHAADGGRRRHDLREPACREPRAQWHSCDAAPAGQPHLAAWLAVQAAVQALENLRIGDSGLGDRIHYRFRRRHHGHRRRLPAGADADLFPAGSDRDRDRHFDGAHAGHHGVGDGDACGHQPFGRRGAGADPNGRRRHRRAIRRAHRAEDARRAAAPAARLAGLRGRLALRLRARREAGRSVFAAPRWERMMRRLALTFAIVLLGCGLKPAAAERLVVSLSNHRVAVTSSFIGEDLVLFGTIEPDAGKPALRSAYDLVVTVTGPRETPVSYTHLTLPTIFSV